MAGNEEMLRMAMEAMKRRRRGPQVEMGEVSVGPQGLTLPPMELGPMETAGFEIPIRPPMELPGFDMRIPRRR